MTYAPNDWYWLADDGRLFSSRMASLVDPEDETYIEWNERNKPTRWPCDDLGEQTDDALQWVFDHAGVSVFVSIDRLRVGLKAVIDVAAEAERLKYITPGEGQAMTYQQKVDEARTFKGASNPKASDYPVLSSEVGITAETLAEVADIVLAAFAQWQQIGAMIESIRLKAKRDIDAAANEAAARAIVDAIEWPQPAL